MNLHAALHAKEVQLSLRLLRARIKSAALQAEKAALQAKNAALWAEEKQLRRELGLPDEVVH